MDTLDNEGPGCGAMPQLDVLVAGTLALMTAWADPCPNACLAPQELRRVLAAKVVSHLYFMQHHPQARPELRLTLAHAHARWMALAADRHDAGSAAALAAAGPGPLH